MVATTDASTAFVALHLAGCGIGWGTAFLFMKLMNGELGPAAIATLRALGATAALMIAVALLRQPVWPRGREWKDWLILGTVNGWAPNILVAYALTRMDSGPTALIQASGPLMTAVLAQAFLPTERVTRAKAFGILVGLAGIVFLIGPQVLQGDGSLLGILAMLLLTFGYAVGNIYARTIPDPAPVRLALGQQSVSGVGALAIALATIGTAGFAPAAGHLPAIAALALLSTALPIWLFMRLITTAGATRASMTGYTIPTVAVVVGVFVLGEPIVPRQILGGALVLLGVAIVTGLLDRRTAA